MPEDPDLAPAMSAERTLDRAINLELLADDEDDPAFKAQLIGQAAAYRTLAAQRARRACGLLALRN
jgi:hypothetical protein